MNDKMLIPTGILKHDAETVREVLGDAEAKAILADAAPFADPSEGLLDTWSNPPPLSPELIGGVLRRGHKMILSGPSKAGKSFALIELAAALAEGRKWLETFQCRKSRVLYLNLEIDRPSFLQRVRKVYEALGWGPTGDIRFLHLRGANAGIDDLVSTIIKICKLRQTEAVVIDPLYKIGVEDENSTKDIKLLCLRLDEIAAATGGAVIFSHHFSKGQQDGKSSMDRASGSGVLARDPDAILTLSELQDAAGFRLEMVLREFVPAAPLSVRFAYPVHRAAPELDDTPLQGARNTGRAAAEAEAARQKRAAEAVEEKSRLQAAILGLADGNRDPARALTKTEFCAAAADETGVAISRVVSEIGAMTAARLIAELPFGSKNRKLIVIPENVEP